MKNYLFLFLITVSLSTFSQVKQDDPFKRMDEEYKALMDRMNQDYEKKMERMQKEYEDRLEKMNKAFESYLKKGFTEVEQIENEEKIAEVPKPIDQPAFEPVVDEPKEVVEEPEPIIIPAPVKPDIVLNETSAISITPMLQLPADADSYTQNINVDFFGSNAALKIDNRMKSLALKSVKPQSFAQYWEDFTQTYYAVYIESMVAYAESKNLNDWGVYQLVQNTSKQLFQASNNKEMWTWAILNQAGYQAKIGYTNQTVCLLLPFMQQIYEKPYYNINGDNFYLLNTKVNAKNIYTYTESFGGATRKIDLHLPFSLNFNDPSNTVTRKTKLPGSDEAINLQLDKTIIAFLNSFPQTDNSVYLNAAMSGSLKEALFEELKPKVEGKSETEAVTYLLSYLHNSFEYKTDRDQFNYEKMFFPDEMFYYPYSDCEDRAVLFTRLVNDLLGMDVVALTYFSHMAAATAFSTPIEGYSVMVDGRKYTITDPTYINAPIGAVMPEYEKYKPLAIRINNDSRSNNMWQMIARSLEQGNEGKVFISDRKMAQNGNYLLSGWFNNQINIGGQSYQAYGGTRDLWYAAFNGGGDLQWFLPVNCTDNAFSQAFNVGKEGNIYSLISYSGTVSLSQRRLARSEQPAHLILGLSDKAYPVLSDNIDFEVPEGKKLAFYGKYKADGTRIDLLSFPTEKVTFDSQITVDSNDEVVVRGVVGEIEGFTKEVPILLASASFSAEDQIESYMKTFADQNYNKHMIALFSALKLLSLNGGRMSGMTVRNLLNKNNPEFYKRNPKIYEGLLRMQFVVNDAGVIKVETYKGDNISLFSMKIKNNSNLQIIQPTEDKYEVKFLNGVQVGKAVVWYDLNSISMDGTSGDLVFDYDKDHAKKTVNIKEIVD
ncbi:hypothetical protein [Carboxylicivirga caseinilyticus]|uniref:hypothetical protein n=1 Tax=Carboxylicivirga caseinilyticus TaxID=3417572 RepID=UPI003D34DAC8|nr:hypothetical protein [Marinilabiliaceae bacterium A049]